MKIIAISFGCLTIALLAHSAFTLRSTNAELAHELEIAGSYQRQAQELASLNTQQKLAFDASIAELQESLLKMESQLSDLSAALEVAKEQIDPDYQQILERARAEAAKEIDSTRSTSNSQAAFSIFSNSDVTRKLAEERTESNYTDYVAAANLSPSEGELFLKALTSFLDERYQMIDLLMQGNLSNDQALAYFGPNAITHNLSFGLTTDQQDLLRAYNLRSSRNAAKTVYSSLLDPSGTLPESETQPMLDVLLDELYSEENNYGSLVSADGSMKSAYETKLQALDRAHTRIQSEYSGAELVQFDQLIESLTGTVDVVLEANDDASGNVNIRNMRISSDNLPN